MTSDVVRWSQLYMQQNKPQKRDDVMTSSEHLRPSYRNHANVNIALANKHSRNTRRSLIAGTVGTQLHKIVLLVLWLVINQNVSLVLSEPILATNNLTIAVKSITGDDEQIHMPVDNDLAVESMSLQDSQNLNQQHSHQTTDDDDSSRHFTPTWAVHVPGGDSVAERIAEDHGFRILGKIFDDYYHFHHSEIRKRSIEPSHHHQTRLNNDDRVRWSQQQHIKTRKKRDFLTFHDQKPYPMLMGKNRVMTSDPKWPAMWYLHRGNGLDMNVIPAWKEGITGKGIVVTILDDGLESDHPDLVENFDPKASYDVNSHDDDPMPHYDMDDSNRHGTRCAGEVAATFNNSLCCVGIAHGASVGGVRMLDGDVTDAVEARSLSLNPQHIDIYSASWGPDDDGKTVDGPGELATRAFIEGVTKGRKGKGSIFIWASGNGGKDHDNCNCDGYTNSIWTLSISSATERGLVPWYSEKCSSTLATTYSSGSKEERQVVTTDLHHSCTASHTGTSASAPLAAGIAALVLEANPSLTWRDLQHIVVRTAKPANLQDPSWSKNGVGRRVSHSFGYGLMDAAAMIKVARTWKTVPEQQRCEIYAPSLDKAISPKSYVVISLKVQPHQCESVNYLEHVQAKISLTSPRRGDIQIFLTSPAGTKVTLLTSRSHDSSRSGFNQWPFMSVHTWGESPHGQWLLEIRNEGRFMAQVTQWGLILHGTEEPAQPNDPKSFDFPQPDPNFLSEIDQSLDFDQTETGQWRNLQQGGENGHNDVQRTAASNDQTDSACLKSLPNKYCIECEQTTFIYEGRCYTACPERTYMLPETPLITKPKTNSTSTKPPRKRAIVQSIPQKKCGACHATCLRCRGPLNNECTECPTESILRGALPNETYCDRASEHNENGWPKVIKLFDNDHNSNNTEHNFSHKSIFKVFFDHISIYMVMAYIVSVIIVMLIIRIACKSFYSNTTTTISNDKKNYAYNRINTVGYDGNDHIIMEHEMIINTSDSSEETETIK
ncbi:furin-like protease 1 isoform X2 [Contarinia nasturtii]|uniref:furin-like protease 1 isoform X2 n=1 Tax=Contarinia nasturtii TaxID=265458 RepID=UPI0012D3C5A7|nr:furin-like protease 1 isoform X2 [Contarinia nasturtii]